MLEAILSTAHGIGFATTSRYSFTPANHIVLKLKKYVAVQALAFIHLSAVLLFQPPVTIMGWNGIYTF